MAHDLASEAEGALHLLQRYNREIYGDKKARQNLIEGQTQLVELTRDVLKEIDACEAAIKAAVRDADQAKRRKESIEERRDALRLELATALIQVGSINVDGATVTPKRMPPSVRIINEAAIPAQFKRKIVKEVVNKAALKSALVDAVIPGAELSNGGVTLAVKR